MSLSLKKMCGRVGNEMPGKRKHVGHEKVGSIGQKKMGTHICRIAIGTAAFHI